MTARRMRIASPQPGYVTIRYATWDGDDRVRTFFLPQGSSYVRESTRDGRDPQVCECLAHGGATLMVFDPTNLADAIRREYRKMRRSDARHGVAA